jgi:hypothetical protein
MVSDEAVGLDLLSDEQTAVVKFILSNVNNLRSLLEKYEAEINSAHIPNPF